MTAYVWPAAWVPRRFRMFVKANERQFQGYYSGQDQLLDLLGERWAAELDLPPCDEATGTAREAFFNRLRGRVNTISLWHMRRPAPRGTQRGTPTLAANVAQLATTINIQGTPNATYLAGDIIGLPGQVSQIMADSQANGSGLFTGVEIWPRARIAMTLGASVLWDKPKVDFRLTDGEGVPVDWGLGRNAGPISLQLIEA